MSIQGESRDFLSEDKACALATSLRANQPPGTAGRIYKAAVLGLAAFAIVALAGCNQPDEENSESLLPSLPRSVIKKHTAYLKQRFKKIIKEKIPDAFQEKNLVGNIIKAGLPSSTPKQNSTFHETVKNHTTRLKSIDAVVKKHLWPERFNLSDGIFNVAVDMMAAPSTYFKIIKELGQAHGDILAILQEEPGERSKLMKEEMREAVNVVLGTLAHEFAERSRHLVESKKPILKSLYEDLQNDPDFKLLTSASTDGGRRLADSPWSPFAKVCGALQVAPVGVAFCVYFPLRFWRVTWEVSGSINIPDEIGADLTMGFGIAKGGGKALGGTALGLTGGGEVAGISGVAVNLAFTARDPGINSLDVDFRFGPAFSFLSLLAIPYDPDAGLSVGVAVQPFDMVFP